MPGLSIYSRWAAKTPIISPLLFWRLQALTSDQRPRGAGQKSSSRKPAAKAKAYQAMAFGTAMSVFLSPVPEVDPSGYDPNIACAGSNCSRLDARCADMGCGYRG